MGTSTKKKFLSYFVVCVLFQNVNCNSHLTVEELFSDYFEWKMATHPQAATMAGYHMVRCSFNLFKRQWIFSKPGTFLNKIQNSKHQQYAKSLPVSYKK